MKNRLLGALVGISLLLILCMQAFAADHVTPSSVSPSETNSKSSASELIAETCDTVGSITLTELDASKPASPDLTVNGESIAEQACAILIGNKTNISVRAMVEALYPGATVQWENGQLIATADNFVLTARPGEPYLVVNDRYLYVPSQILFTEDRTMAPIRVLGKALGASVDWNAQTRDITVLTTGSPLAPGSSYYSSDALYWLSRIINAESGNQPLSGKIAVGTVILNRVSSSQFPNTIEGVICQRVQGVYQFTPVRNGSIRKTPNANSVIAAKLCLDGAREAEQSLFFNRAGLKCWAARNRAYVTTIANHSFYS